MIKHYQEKLFTSFDSVIKQIYGLQPLEIENKNENTGTLDKKDTKCTCKDEVRLSLLCAL